jgi:hypothetical protein
VIDPFRTAVAGDCDRRGEGVRNEITTGDFADGNCGARAFADWFEDDCSGAMLDGNGAEDCGIPGLQGAAGDFTLCNLEIVVRAGDSEARIRDAKGGDVCFPCFFDSLRIEESTRAPDCEDRGGCFGAAFWPVVRSFLFRFLDASLSSITDESRFLGLGSGALWAVPLCARFATALGRGVSLSEDIGKSKTFDSIVGFGFETGAAEACGSSSDDVARFWIFPDAWFLLFRDAVFAGRATGKSSSDSGISNMESFVSFFRDADFPLGACFAGSPVPHARFAAMSFA